MHQYFIEVTVVIDNIEALNVAFHGPERLF